VSERLYDLHKRDREIQATISFPIEPDRPVVTDYVGLPLALVRAKKVPRRGYADGRWMWSLRVRDPNGNDWVGRGRGPLLWLRPVGRES